MKGILNSSKAILIGTLVDLSGTWLSQISFGMTVGMGFSLYWTAIGMSGPTVEHKIKLLEKNPLILLLTLALGMFFSFLGGFFAAQQSKDHEIRNASIVGALGIMWGIIFWFIVPPPNQIYGIVGLILTLPISLLGGWLITQIKYGGYEDD